MKKSLGILAALVLLSPVHAQVGTDVASNYVAWTNGSNGGSGFGPWDFTATTGNFSLSSSTLGAGNINTGGVSFTMTGSGSNSAVATRSFAGGVSLPSGALFSVYLSVNFRNGSKGIELRNGVGTLFEFDVSSDNYFFGGVELGSEGWGYVSDGVYELQFEVTTPTSMRASVLRLSNSTPSQNRFYEISNFTLSAPIDNVSFYINGTDASPLPENSLYINNLEVVPEPSTWALAVAGLIGLLLVRNRKSKHQAKITSPCSHS